MRRLALALAFAALTTPVFAADAYKAPRNALGQPDLEGVWTNASLTGLERGPQFKTLVIPEAQARQVETMRAKMMDAQSRPTDPNGEARFELAKLSLAANDPLSAEKEARRACDLLLFSMQEG